MATASTVTSIKDDVVRKKRLEEEIAATNVDTKFSDNFWRVDDVKLVENELLSKAFLNAKKEISSKGRSQDELSEVLMFSVENERRIGEICRAGPKVGLKKRHVLGYTGSGIHLVRHFDVLTRYMAFQQFVSPSIVVLYKCILGKQKPVYPRLHKDDNYVLPNVMFDCHISSRPVEPKMPICEALNCSYVYLFQLGKASDPMKYPQQILPYAVLTLQKKHPVHISYAMCAVGQSEDSPKWEVKGETRSGYRYNFIKRQVRHRSKHITSSSPISTLKGQLLEMRSKVRDSQNDKSSDSAESDTNIKWNGRIIDETQFHLSMKPFVKLERLQPCQSESFKTLKCCMPSDSTVSMIETEALPSSVNTLGEYIGAQDDSHCSEDTAVDVTRDQKVISANETDTDSTGFAKIVSTRVEDKSLNNNVYSSKVKIFCAAYCLGGSSCDNELATKSFRNEDQQLAETLSLTSSSPERLSPVAAASAPETLNICPSIGEAKVTDLEPGMTVSGSSFTDSAKTKEDTSRMANQNFATAIEVSTQGLQNVRNTFTKQTPVAQTECTNNTENCAESSSFSHVSQNAVRTMDKYCEAMDFKEPLQTTKKQRSCIDVSKGITIQEPKEQRPVGRIDESTALKVKNILSERFRSVNLMKKSDASENKVLKNNDRMPVLEFCGENNISFSKGLRTSEREKCGLSRTDTVADGSLKVEDTTSLCQDEDSQDTVIYSINVSNLHTLAGLADNKPDKITEHISRLHESEDSNDSEEMPHLRLKDEPLENYEYVISSSTACDMEPEHNVMNETGIPDESVRSNCLVSNCDSERGDKIMVREDTSAEVNCQTLEVKTESEFELNSSNRRVSLTCSSLIQNIDQTQPGQIDRENDLMESISSRSDSITLLDRSETHDSVISSGISLKTESSNVQQATDPATTCDENFEVVERQDIALPDQSSTVILAEKPTSIFAHFKSPSQSQHHFPAAITQTLSEMTSFLENMRKIIPQRKANRHIRNKQETKQNTLKKKNDKTYSIDNEMRNSNEPHHETIARTKRSGNNPVKKRTQQAEENMHASGIKRKRKLTTVKQPIIKKQKLNNVPDKIVCSKSAAHPNSCEQDSTRKTNQLVSSKTSKPAQILKSSKQSDKSNRCTRSLNKLTKKYSVDEASKQAGVNRKTSEMKETNVSQINDRKTHERNMQQPKKSTLLKLAPDSKRTQSSINIKNQGLQKDRVERRIATGENKRKENANQVTKQYIKSLSNKGQVRPEAGHEPIIGAEENNRNTTVHQASVSKAKYSNALANEKAFAQSELPEHSEMASYTLPFSPGIVLDKHRSAPTDNASRQNSDKNEVLIECLSNSMDIQSVEENKVEPKTVIDSTNITPDLATERTSMKHNATAGEAVVYQSELPQHPDRDMVSSTLPSSPEIVDGGHKSASMANASRPQTDKFIDSQFCAGSNQNVEGVCVWPSKVSEGNASNLTPDRASGAESTDHNASTHTKIDRQSGLLGKSDQEMLMVSSTLPSSPVANVSRAHSDRRVSLGRTSKAVSSYHFEWTSENVVTQSGLTEHSDRDRMLVTSSLPSSHEIVFGDAGSMENASRQHNDNNTVPIESQFNINGNRKLGKRSVEQNTYTEGNNIILTLDNASEAVSTYHYAWTNENVVTQTQLPEHTDREMLMVSSTLPSSPEFDEHHYGHMNIAPRPDIDTSSVSIESYSNSNHIQIAGEDRVEPGTDTGGDNIAWNYANEALQTINSTWPDKNVSPQFNVPGQLDQYLWSLRNALPSSEFYSGNHSGHMYNASQMTESNRVAVENNAKKRNTNRNLRKKRLKLAQDNFLSTESMKEFQEWQKFKKEQRIRKQINDALAEYQRTVGDSRRLLNDLTRHTDLDEGHNTVHVHKQRFLNKGTSKFPSGGKNKIYYSRYISSQRNRFDQHAKGANYRKQTPSVNRHNFMLRKSRSAQIPRFQNKSGFRDSGDTYFKYNRKTYDHGQSSKYGTNYLQENHKKRENYEDKTAGYAEEIGTSLEYRSDNIEEENFHGRKADGHIHDRQSTYSPREERCPTIIENGIFVQRGNYSRNRTSDGRDKNDRECQVRRLKTDRELRNHVSPKDECKFSRGSVNEPIDTDTRNSYRISRDSRNRLNDAPRTNGIDDKDRIHKPLPYARKQHTEHDRSNYSRDKPDKRYKDRHDHYRQSDRSYYDHDRAGKRYTNRMQSTCSSSRSNVDRFENNAGSRGGYLVQEEVSITSLSMAISTLCKEARKRSMLQSQHGESKASNVSHEGQPIPVISSQTVTRAMQYPYPTASSTR